MRVNSPPAAFCGSTVRVSAIRSWAIGKRDALRAHLTARGIGTQVHYPVPIHLQEAARFLGYKGGDLPVTERLADEVLSIPMYPELTDTQQQHVTSSIREFMK